MPDNVERLPAEARAAMRAAGFSEGDINIAADLIVQGARRAVAAASEVAELHPHPAMLPTIVVSALMNAEAMVSRAAEATVGKVATFDGDGR